MNNTIKKFSLRVNVNDFDDFVKEYNHLGENDLNYFKPFYKNDSDIILHFNYRPLNWTFCYNKFNDTNICNRCSNTGKPPCHIIKFKSKLKLRLIKLNNIIK